jgi:hypothetical protein
MNKIQESFYKIVTQYVKETYPNDPTLKYLIDGIDNFTDQKIQVEVDKPKLHCTPISETLLIEKDRIKEIMNKVLDVNFKPTGKFIVEGNHIKQSVVFTPNENRVFNPDDDIIKETLSEIHANNPMTKINLNDEKPLDIGEVLNKMDDITPKVD